MSLIRLTKLFAILEMSLSEGRRISIDWREPVGQHVHARRRVTRDILGAIVTILGANTANKVANKVVFF